MTEDTKLTLEDRSKFESLLAEYANAEMDLMRATSRRHDALHRILGYVNKRTATLVEEAKAAQPELAMIVTHDEVAVEVPAGTQTPKAFHDAEVARGAKHYRKDAPVPECSCATCCEARALAGILTRNGRELAIT